MASNCPRRLAMRAVSLPTVEHLDSEPPSIPSAGWLTSLAFPDSAAAAASGTALAEDSLLEATGRNGGTRERVPSSGGGTWLGGTPDARRMMASSTATSRASPSATSSSRTHRWYAPSLGLFRVSALRSVASSGRASCHRDRWPSMQVTRKAGEDFDSRRCASTRGCKAARKALQTFDATSSGFSARRRSVLEAAATSSSPKVTSSSSGSSVPPSSFCPGRAMVRGRFREPCRLPPAACSATLAALASSSYFAARAMTRGRKASCIKECRPPSSSPASPSPRM
mmetsp:Transcript_24320/g.54141  ORF Transcript_24320/g.54141 Transcript_24320/m.54141 type:complete len:283 (-) Transcript_24320:248-1096(-)